jgi:hypothetical protein
MTQALAINGTSIKRPTTPMTILHYNITKSSRSSSGLMSMDLIAKKRKFEFSYDSLTGPELSTILSLIDTDTMFFTFTYIDNNVSKSAEVYVGDIQYIPYRTGSVWVYRDVKFDLIER